MPGLNPIEPLPTGDSLKQLAFELVAQWGLNADDDYESQVYAYGEGMGYTDQEIDDLGEALSEVLDNMADAYRF